MCDYICITSACDPESLWSLLERVEKELRNGKINMVIVDSITALFRGNEDFTTSSDSLALRSRWFFAISQKMKQMSFMHSCPFIVTNQVTCKYIEGGSGEARMTVNIPGMSSHLFCVYDLITLTSSTLKSNRTTKQH